MFCGKVGFSVIWVDGFFEVYLFVVFIIVCDSFKVFLVNIVLYLRINI